MREIRTPRSVGTGGGRPPPVTRWVWKRSHGRTSEAPSDERGGNRYVRPTATAPHSDSTNSCPTFSVGSSTARRRNRTLGHPWVNELDRPEAALGDECGDRPRWVRSLAAGGGSGNGGSGCWAPRRLQSTMMPLWLLVWRGLPCWISGLTSVKWLTRSGGLLAPFRPPPSLAQSRSLVFLGDLVHAGWTGASVKPVF